MKSITLFFTLFILSFYLCAQESNEEENYFVNKHEISLSFSNILSNQEFPFWSYYYYDIYYEDLYLLEILKNKPVYGLGYKYHFTNSALRFNIAGSYDLGKQNFEDDDAFPDISTTDIEYKYLYGNFNIGFEFHKNFKRTQIYYGIDGILKLYNLRYKYNRVRTYNSYTPPYTSTTKDDNKMTKTNFGFAPLIGVEYYLTPNLSFAVETRISFEYYKGITKTKHTNTSYGSSSTNDDKYENSGINTEFGPLGHISICLHL